MRPTSTPYITPAAATSLLLSSRPPGSAHISTTLTSRHGHTNLQGCDVFWAFLVCCPAGFWITIAGVLHLRSHAFLVGFQLVFLLSFFWEITFAVAISTVFAVCLNEAHCAKHTRLFCLSVISTVCCCSVSWNNPPADIRIILTLLFCNVQNKVPLMLNQRILVQTQSKLHDQW